MYYFLLDLALLIHHGEETKRHKNDAITKGNSMKSNMTRCGFRGDGGDRQIPAPVMDLEFVAVG